MFGFITNACIFVTALFAALLIIPFLHRWALERGELDRPDPRKVHKLATPRLGGIAIFLSFLFSLLALGAMTPAARGILAGGLVVFVTGLVDDLGGLSPRLKFLGEIAGCLLTITIGKLYITHLGNLFGFGAVDLPPWLGIAFTVFAVVGVINAVNLIDGLDGLSGGVSVIALSAFWILSVQDGNLVAAAISAGLLGAVLGFLKYNFYPARIFMGDAGSLSVGFVLGFLAVLLTQTSGAGIGPMVPVLILGVPILDTVWVLCSRALRGGSPFVPDRTHVHHKFLDLGLQHRFTVLLIYAVSLFWAIFALILRRQPGWELLACFLPISIGNYLALRHMLRHPVHFTWLRRDSGLSLRESLLFQRLAVGTDRVVPVLTGLILLYLVAGMLAGGASGEAGPPWLAIGLLIVGCLGILLARDLSSPLLLGVLYLIGLAATLGIEYHGRYLVEPGISLERMGDGLLLLIAALAGIKVLLRRDGELFLARIDLILLGLSIFLAVTLQSLDPAGLLVEAFLKGIVLVLGIKIVTTFSRRQGRVIVAGTLVTLGALVVAGMV